LSFNIARKMGRGETLIKKESSQTKEQWNNKDKP
jgi:hypothetical protein